MTRINQLAAFAGALIIAILTLPGAPVAQNFRILPSVAGNNTLAPHEFPPVAHWDLREFPSCRVPWAVGSAPIPDLDGNGMANQPLDLALFATVLVDAFNRWDAVAPNQLGFFGAASGVPNGGPIADGWNTVVFDDTTNAPEVNAVTILQRDAATGVISEVDIVFNSLGGNITIPGVLELGPRQWVIFGDGMALEADLDLPPLGDWPNGANDTDEDNDGVQDYQVDLGNVATHEIGHFLGLGHAEPLGTAHNNNNNGMMEQLWLLATGPKGGGWTNLTLKDIDKDGMNYLYCPDLGDAPDPWMGTDGLYPTKVHDPGAGRTLNGITLDDKAVGAEHIFGIKPRQSARNWTYEWLAVKDGGDVDGECYPWMVDKDKYDDGITVFPNPPIWLRDLSVTAYARYASDDASNAHDYGAHPMWLNSWIDLNQDCVWSAGERYMNHSLSPAAPAGANTVQVQKHTATVHLPLPPDPLVPVWLRIRLDYGEDVGAAVANGVDGTLDNPRGAAQHGEVEDYQFWCSSFYQQSYLSNTTPQNVIGICQIYPGPLVPGEQNYWAAVSTDDCPDEILPAPVTAYDPSLDQITTQYLSPPLVPPGGGRHAGKCYPNNEYLTMLRSYWIPELGGDPTPDLWIPGVHAAICYTPSFDGPQQMSVAIGVANAAVGGWIAGTPDPSGSMIWDDSLFIDVSYRIAPSVLPLEQLSPCDSFYASLPLFPAGTATITPERPMEISLNVPGNIAPGEVIILEVQSNFHNTNPTINNQILEFPVPIGGDATSVGDPLPAATFALRSYPNPFNPTTTIQYSLPHASTVTLSVYDVTGRWVRTLVDGEFKDAGPHEVGWDATDHRGRALPSGVYFYRLFAGGRVLTGRAVLLK